MLPLDLEWGRRLVYAIGARFSLTGDVDFGWEDGLRLASKRPPRAVMPERHNCYRQMVLSLMDLSRQFGRSIEDG